MVDINFDDKFDFAKYCLDLRQAYSISSTDMAMLLGMPVKIYHQIEDGKRIPRGPAVIAAFKLEQKLFGEYLKDSNTRLEQELAEIRADETHAEKIDEDHFETAIDHKSATSLAFHQETPSPAKSISITGKTKPAFSQHRRRISGEQLDLILEEHELWLDSEGQQGARANLDYVNLQKADLFHVNLRGASLRGANMQKLNLVYTDLSDADLEGANLQNANLCDTNLQNANCRKANLQYADGYNANFQAANLTEANLQQAKFDNSNLQAATLSKANLQNVSLSRANLQKADLQNSILHGANLDSANLQEATLRGSLLLEATLDGANLQKAILSAADCRKANFNKSNLHSAIFVDTNLEGATFDGVDLSGALVANAIGLNPKYSTSKKSKSIDDQFNDLAFSLSSQTDQPELVSKSRPYDEKPTVSDNWPSMAAEFEGQPKITFDQLCEEISSDNYWNDNACKPKESLNPIPTVSREKFIYPMAKQADQNQSFAITEKAVESLQRKISSLSVLVFLLWIFVMALIVDYLTFLGGQ
jgi:uncharacterized protein YjbI with pentapeptide repeats